MLDQITSKICEILKVNEWKNTANLTNRFKKYESESSHKFVMFDIKYFYPSIKEGLLIEDLEFAKQIQKQSFTLENVFCTIKENHGTKTKATISTLQWDHTRELKYVNLSVYSC